MKPPVIKGDPEKPEKKKAAIVPTSFTTTSGIKNANAAVKDKVIPYYENTDYLIKNKLGRTGYWNAFQDYAKDYTLPSGEKFIQNEQANKGTTNEFSDKLLADYKAHLLKTHGNNPKMANDMAITPEDIRQVQTYYKQGNPNFKVDSRIGGETSQLRYPHLNKVGINIPEGSYAPVFYGKNQYLAPADKYNAGDITDNLIKYDPSYDAKIDPTALKALVGYTTQATNPVQRRANGGKIMPPKKVKGYANGTPEGGVEGEYDPNKPISGQGIIQTYGTPFVSTGNATNAQGQKSSQVDPTDPYGKNKNKGKINTEDLFSKQNISGALAAGTSLSTALAANQQQKLEGAQKDKATANAINASLDTVASMVPVYGQIYGATQLATGLVTNALPKDANGNYKTKESEATANFMNVLSPHKAIVNDLSKGDTTRAIGDTLTGGIYGSVSDLITYEDRQKQAEAEKQKKLDEYRKINTQAKIKQSLHNRDLGEFGAPTRDVYDINSAQFDDAGNFQSINPTGYKGGGVVGKVKQMYAKGGDVKPTITNDKVMEIAMSGKGYDALNKYDKQRVDAMKQHISDNGNKEMPMFPNMVQGKADGGKVSKSEIENNKKWVSDYGDAITKSGMQHDMLNDSKIGLNKYNIILAHQSANVPDEIKYSDKHVNELKKGLDFYESKTKGYAKGGIVGEIKNMYADGGKVKPTKEEIEMNKKWFDDYESAIAKVEMQGNLLGNQNNYNRSNIMMNYKMSDAPDYIKYSTENTAKLNDAIKFYESKYPQGYADGGKIEGKGTAKSDSIMAKVEEGSFVVPAENADMAKGIRKLYLKAPVRKANLNQKEGEEVKLSNGEHLFTPQENEYLESIGINLEDLAPNAEHEENGKKNGGLTSAKAKTILHDKHVNGKPLTDKQRKFFGAIASGQSIKGYAAGGDVVGEDEVDPAKELARLKKEKEDLDKAQQAKAKYEEAVRSKREAEFKGKVESYDRKADRKNKIASWEKKRNDSKANLDALNKSYEAASKEFKARNTPTAEQKAKGVKEGSDTNEQRKYKEDLLKKIQAAKSEFENADRTFNYVKDDNNYDASGNTKTAPKDAVVAKNVSTTPINTTVPKDATTATTGTSTKPTGLKAPSVINKKALADLSKEPLVMKKAPLASDAVPSDVTLTANSELPNMGGIKSVDNSAPVYNKKRGSGILNALGNIDPTMGVGPMQTAMGINMLQGSVRPIDKAVLDATYNANVNRAQEQSGYGYTPEQMAMLQQENQASLNDARFSARNLSLGNAGTSYNQEMQAINKGWANKLGLTAADQELRMQKQKYADAQVANRADTLSANRRQAYLDALGAFNQKQAAGSELIGAGLQNVIGAYRYNQELNNENKVDAQRNYWTSQIGKTDV